MGQVSDIIYSGRQIVKKSLLLIKPCVSGFLTLQAGQTIEVDKALRYTEGNLENFSCSWSSDSRWVTYARDMGNYHSAVFLYDFQNKSLRQVTDGYYDCSNPVFDPEGKYIYLLTSQSFNPSYSDIDNSFIYANTGQVAVISLLKKQASYSLSKE